MEEELFLIDNLKKKKKLFVFFKTNEIVPGFYELVIEYRNQQVFND